MNTPSPIGRPFSPTDLTHPLIARLGEVVEFDGERVTIADVTVDGAVTLVDDRDIVRGIVRAADVEAALADEQAENTAVDEFAALVEAVGPGFHPDTPGSDYTNLPAGYTADEVDRIVEAVLAADLDPYEIALDLMCAAGWWTPEGGFVE